MYTLLKKLPESDFTMVVQSSDKSNLLDLLKLMLGETAVNDQVNNPVFFDPLTHVEYKIEEMAG